MRLRSPYSSGILPLQPPASTASTASTACRCLFCLQMLHCSASTHRCIPTLFSYLFSTQLTPTSFPRYLLTRNAARHPTCLRRGYATEASLARELPDRRPALIPQLRTHWVDPPPNPPYKLESYDKLNLQLEVRWLKDPVKLADHTVKLLRDNDFRKALEIVRMASKYVQCTVSWNHLIDYEMSKARVTNAVKLYNEASSYLVHRSASMQG